MTELIEPKLKSEPVRVCILTDLDSGEALSTVRSRFTEPLQRLLDKHEVDEPLSMGTLEGHAHIPTWSLSERSDMKIALCFPHPNAARGIAVTLETALMELVCIPAVRDALVSDVLRRYRTWTLTGSTLMSLVDEQLPQLLQGAGRLPLPENPKEKPAWLMAILALHPSQKFPEVVFKAAAQTSPGLVAMHFAPVCNAIAWLQSPPARPGVSPETHPAGMC